MQMSGRRREDPDRGDIRQSASWRFRRKNGEEEAGEGWAEQRQEREAPRLAGKERGFQVKLDEAGALEAYLVSYLDLNTGSERNVRSAMASPKRSAEVWQGEVEGGTAWELIQYRKQWFDLSVEHQRHRELPVLRARPRALESGGSEGEAGEQPLLLERRSQSGRVDKAMGGIEDLYRNSCSSV